MSKLDLIHTTYLTCDHCLKTINGQTVFVEHNFVSKSYHPECAAKLLVEDVDPRLSEDYKQLKDAFSKAMSIVRVFMSNAGYLQRIADDSKTAREAYDDLVDKTRGIIGWI